MFQWSDHWHAMARVGVAVAGDVEPRARGAALQQALLALEDYLGRVEPGTLLPSERELARRFGVSRTTLRSAIAELALRGRLEVRHGTGTVAAHGRAAEASDLSPAAIGIAPRDTAADLAEICELLGAQLARLAAQRAPQGSARDLASQTEAGDAAFHLAVAAASGNASAKELLARLHASIERARGDGSPTQAAGQERLLLDLRRAVASAIASGDGDAAGGTMSLYLATWRRLNRLA